MPDAAAANESAGGPFPPGTFNPSSGKRNVETSGPPSKHARIEEGEQEEEEEEDQAGADEGFVHQQARQKPWLSFSI